LHFQLLDLEPGTQPVCATLRSRRVTFGQRGIALGKAPRRPK